MEEREKQKRKRSLASANNLLASSWDGTEGDKAVCLELVVVVAVVVVHGVAFWCGRWNTFSLARHRKRRRQKNNFFRPILPCARARLLFPCLWLWKQPSLVVSDRTVSAGYPFLGWASKERKKEKSSFISSYFTFQEMPKLAAMIPKGSINITVIWYFFSSLLCYCVFIYESTYVCVENTLRADKPVWSLLLKLDDVLNDWKSSRGCFFFIPFLSLVRVEWCRVLFTVG
jgi:hypothetical protein